VVVSGKLVEENPVNSADKDTTGPSVNFSPLLQSDQLIDCNALCRFTQEVSFSKRIPAVLSLKKTLPLGTTSKPVKLQSVLTNV
jgi:hypothetical protein